MRKLYKFKWDCGRTGGVESLFIANELEVKACIGRRVYFGEILGKHSEIYGTLAGDDLTILTDDQEFIDKLQTMVGRSTISGYNPLDYLEEEED